ncbi:MAG TPA: hypothetical protein VG389_08650 [Myxococcota bacterium]|jgi:hypothetical protein|nr:hypothetical protein [Myxococcota bacterium]
MRALALVGAALMLLVAAPVRTAAAATPLVLHPPPLLGAAESPALAGPEAGGLAARGLDRIHPDLLLPGLGLMAGGIVAGAAGFMLLYFCDPAGVIGCYDPTLNVVGWVLAAPGIIPLAIGSILVYISLNSSRGYAAAPPAALTAMYVSPVRGGAVVSTSFTF